MNKQKIIEMKDNHREIFRVAYAMVNRIPFNNSWGGGIKPDIGLSLLKGCKIVNRGANNRIIIGDYSRLINCTITISGSNNTIIIGDYSRLINCTITISGSNNTIYIDNRCVCNHACFWIEDDNNSIRLGEHTALCGAIGLAATEGTEIEIGKDCLFSSTIDIRTGDSHSLIQQGTKNRLNYSASVKIGNHVWIGTGVTILKGTSIADNCMVGAASLLCKQYSNPNCVIAGVPAKEVKRNIDWMEERI